MSANLSQVADILFKEFAKINNPELKHEALKEQLERSKAVVAVSKQIIEVGRLALDAQLGIDNMMEKAKLPKLLEMD